MSDSSEYVVGLNHGEINSSAAILRDGLVIAGSPEERFNRQKRTKAFPTAAVEFCLEQAGVSLRDCAAVAQAWNPAALWHKFNPLISGARIRREDYFYSVPDNLLQLAGRRESEWVCLNSDVEELPPVYYVLHHRTHAANAFYLSPFEEAAILTCDHRGEYECTTWGKGTDAKIETFARQTLPDSLGLFYAAYTQLLGYRYDSDEWKVMALSAFDVDARREIEAIRSTLRVSDEGGLELDQSYYPGSLVEAPKLYSRRLIELLGGREGMAGEEADDWHRRIAVAMQTVAEEIAVKMLTALWDRTRCPNVTLGGGFFMNSVFNGKLLDATPFRDLYISYAPADVGNSIGAGLYVTHMILGKKRYFQDAPSAIGPEFSDDDIERTLIRRKISYSTPDNMAGKVAELLADGEIVSVFNAKMEFGERALGNRSILADARRNEMKDKINSAIKYRESYRPFAPAILEERVREYFDVPQGFTCRYMEKVVPIKPERRSEIAAVSHVDGSGRVQTVSEKENSFFYDVIKSFGARTGTPVVLNTSFNVNGEPIACSPDDALTTFFNSGLEYLALGRYLVSKAP